MHHFEQTQRVDAQHLDELQHVNNVQYLQWVQDIAGAHWQKLIEGKDEHFGLWVVRSHHIEYKRQAKLGDCLRVETDVRVTDGYLSERRVRFFLEESNQLVAQCSTQWCYLDPNSHKLLRIPPAVKALLHEEEI